MFVQVRPELKETKAGPGCQVSTCCSWSLQVEGSPLNAGIQLAAANRSTARGPSLCDSLTPTPGSFKTGSDPRVTPSVAQAAVTRSQSDRNILCCKSVDLPLSHRHLSSTWGAGLKCFWHCRERDSLPSSHADTTRTSARKLFCSWLSFTSLEKESCLDRWDESHRDEAPQPARQQEHGGGSAGEEGWLLWPMTEEISMPSSVGDAGHPFIPGSREREMDAGVILISPQTGEDETRENTPSDS